MGENKLAGHVFEDWCWKSKLQKKAKSFNSKQEHSKHPRLASSSDDFQFGQAEL